MRSPSERLIQILTSSELCSRAEIDACEPLVRRLSQDLPDFDSVWLDALVTQNSLTSWQAEQLQNDDPDNLTVGRFHLLKPLGRSTYLATQKTQPPLSVLRRVATTGLAMHGTMERRLSELIAELRESRKSKPRILVLPSECLTSNSDRVDQTQTFTEDFAPELFVRSDYVPGWSMDELLIRGGRLPFEMVAEVGRDLLGALAWLEESGTLHGDVVLRNVRLDPRGHLHLVDPFVRRLIQPQFSLTDRLTLHDCDGVAPEQVGTGRTADARSELYALGCLLWQLLTTRPVTLSADPVTRLMKQKEQDIIDVRVYVPDCPEWMAKLIQAMTRRSPELRPASASDVLKHWRLHSGGGLTHCRRLAAGMPDRTLRLRPRRKLRSGKQRSSRMWPAAAGAALLLLVVTAARFGVLPQSLNLDRFLTATSSDGTESLSTPDPLGNPLLQGSQPLPAIDPDGRILLQPGVHYVAERRDFPGDLKIVSAQQTPAIIEVSTTVPWILSARTVELQGIRLVQQSSSSAVAEASDAASVEETPKRVARQLLAVQCSTLTMRSCLIQSPSLENEFVGVEWHRPRGAEGLIVIKDSVFAGGGYGLSCNHPPRRCELDNVLLANRGAGLLTEFQKGDADSWEFECRNVTQRFGFSLLDAIVHEDSIRSLTLGLTSTECVYEPQTAVLRLKTPASWRAENMKIQFRAGETGNPAIVPPNVASVVYIDSILGQPVILPQDQITEDTLLPAELEFETASANGDAESGLLSRSPWFVSTLRDFEGPKLTDRMPGIDAKRLPESERQP